VYSEHGTQPRQRVSIKEKLNTRRQFNKMNLL